MVPFPHHLAKLLHQGGREGGVVEVVRQADQLPPRPRPKTLLEGGEERSIGLGVPEGAAGRVEQHLVGRHARIQDEPVPHTLSYAVGDNRVDITLDSGGSISLWWATKNEWLGLVDVAGLELEALYGGFAREPLTDDSHEYVFVTRR